MTMTKCERGEMEELRYQLRLARAFRVTPPVETDVAIPRGVTGELAKGFLYYTYNSSFRVVPACTDSVCHSYDRNDRTESRGAMRLYSTRLLALRACRNDAEQQCMRWLADIDKAIEDEERKVGK